MKQIQKLFEEYRDHKGFSGVAMIKKNGEILFQFQTGYQNRMYQIDNQIDTSFDTASITKLFTAAGIVLLESQGLLHFDDRIHTILDLQGTAIPQDVTIQHLLTHTSGIADDAEEEKGEDYSVLFYQVPNYRFRENEDFLKNFVYKKPNFRAGEQICYNNCAFILLGLVIEKKTGRKYRDFITDEIFHAFHMDHTFFADKEDWSKPFAEGYFYDEKGELKKNIYSFPPIGTADSGAYTTVGDLDQFIRTVSQSPVFHKMLEPQTQVQRKTENGFYTVGYAFELLQKDHQVIRAHKDGQNNGVCNITVFYPKEDITFTILGNVDCNIWELNHECEKILFGGSDEK